MQRRRPFVSRRCRGKPGSPSMACPPDACSHVSCTASANDVQLADASVHRHHAVVHHADDERFIIKDLSGREGNGVKVNGQRVAEAALASGDVIEVGTVVLRFEARAT